MPWSPGAAATSPQAPVTEAHAPRAALAAAQHVEELCCYCCCGAESLYVALSPRQLSTALYKTQTALLAAEAAQAREGAPHKAFRLECPPLPFFSPVRTDLLRKEHRQLTQRSRERALCGPVTAGDEPAWALHATRGVRTCPSPRPQLFSSRTAPHQAYQTGQSHRL